MYEKFLMEPINRKHYSVYFIWPGQLLILCFILLILVSHSSYCQSTLLQPSSLRRHFIIAYDTRTAQDNNAQINISLRSLFTREGLQNNPGVVCSELFNKDIKEGKLFFDPSSDGISFFYFGISQGEFAPLWHVIESYPKDSVRIDTTFFNLFIKNTELTWSGNKRSGSHDNESLNRLFNTFINKKSDLVSFNNGYSNPDLVPYSIFRKFPDNSYASEYILLIVGRDEISSWQNQLFSIPDNGSLASQYIQNNKHILSSVLTTVPLLFYSDPTSLFIKGTAVNTTKIKVYKLLPAHALLMENKPEFTIESDARLSQGFLTTTRFKISSTGIRKNLNEKFSLKAIGLSIFSDKENGSRYILDSLLFTKTNNFSKSGNLWESIFTSIDSGQIMNIPKLELSIPALRNGKKLINLFLQYNFYTQYQVAGKLKLNYIYTAHRLIESRNIQYSSGFIRIFIFYILPFIITLCGILFLFLFGKPRGLDLTIEGYLDSFEIIDYKTVGRLILPFKPWNIDKQTVDYLPVNGTLIYKSQNFLLNWNANVYLRLQDVAIPAGFELFLKSDTQHQKEFPSGIPIPIELNKGKNNKIAFVVGIRQNEITKQIINPELIKFTVEAVVKDSRLFFKSDIRKTIEYSFHIGTDLGDVWVGFDPGTSGSCVAIGSATDNIILGMDRAEKTIIPSILVFEKAENFHPDGVKIPEKIYKHGTEAQTLYPTTSKFKGFQSIKKLLGFKDIKEIVFDNRETLKLKGKELAGLLVKGLFNDIQTFFDKSYFDHEEYKRDGKFNPLRAVVAIPNNCTINKIQDMVDCIGNLNQFKEVRYVYEAEAVLFYYLSNFSQLCKGEKSMQSETILVFDMGGATINATVVTAKKTLVNERPKYDIDFLGKIGYGIGGDTIDYCIIRFILSFTDEFTQFGVIGIIDKKIQLADLAFQIKKEIISNYYANKEYLITADNLQRFINNAGLGVKININDETSEMYRYFIKETGKFKLFEHHFFNNTIFNNVKDAVNEVVALSNTTRIDKVIFSGRSTAFPMIKETVEKQLKSKDIKTKIIILGLEESKTAVAKGACWYGLNKNSVRLNNLKTNAAFGFRKTLSADMADVNFHELVEMGRTFDIRNDGIDSFQGVESITDDFAFDGCKVNFYQVMGKDADKILSEGQKHKFSKIAGINLDQLTSKVAMKINENDEVECAVILQSNRKIVEKGEVSDQEIDEANEEHYTWLV